MSEHTSRALRFFALLALLAGTGACGDPDPRTEVLVTIDAEQFVRSEAVLLRIRVSSGPGTADGSLDQQVIQEYGGTGNAPFPTVVGIVPAGGDATRVFELEASAIDRAERVVGRARVRTGFVAGRTLGYRLVLEDRCRGILCGAGETCTHASCTDDFVDPAELGPYVPGGSVDAGVDSGDAGGPCTGHAACDDGVFCNGAELCIGGVCAPGTRPDCDDGHDCTTDGCADTACTHTPDDTFCPGGTCDPQDGCQFATCDSTNCTNDAARCLTAICVGAHCDRALACTGGQSCCGGACVAPGCDDRNPCTSDACVAGACSNLPSMTTCSDGDACTMNDQCSGGACAGVTATCDDGNPCTSDNCTPGVGCTNAPIAASCDDGDACTAGDQCMAGTCRPGVPNPCSDGVACTTDSCAGGTCSHVPSNALCPGGTCDAVNGCQSGSCTAATCVAGPCETAACEGGICVRRSLCDAGQICCGGACAAAGCNDNEPCTDDSCGAGGCVHTPNTAPCDDHNGCTDNEACSGGVCRGSVNCDDGLLCTTDYCNAAGNCRTDFNTVMCNDGNPCTVGDACGGGTCQGVARDCSDAFDCTDDACDSSGNCTHSPANDRCDDGNDCTRNTCSSSVGCEFPKDCAGSASCCM